ncbi:hypothetical protein IGI37_002862 [Enterococcus sp. AZ194]|uniref:zinc ribbon domain-containing protein n=1 Tax=Enterococcus sp. AZ194 TaxID=2774629 RepID=UPI003F206E4D
MKLCKNCGHENVEESKFCENCGSVLETSETETSVNKVTQEVPEDLAENEEVLANKTSESTPAEEASSPETVETTEPETADQVEADVTVTPTETAKESGEDMQDSKAINSQEQSNQETPTPAKKGSLSKKQITIGAVVVIILVALFGGYKYGSSIYTSENQIDAFVQAITDKDSKKVVQMMTTDDDHLDLTEKNVKPLIKYFTENKKALAEMKKDMKKNLRTYNLEIKKSGKKFLVFDDYKVEVYPVYPEVSTNQKGTIISVNDEKYTTTKEDSFDEELGPFVPGVYKFSAASEKLTESSESNEKTYNLFNSEDTEIDLTFSVMIIPIESNIKDAKILVDGKEAGKLKDGEGTVGPLVWHDGLTIQLTSGEGKDQITTEEYEVEEWEYTEDSEDDYPVSLDFDVVDMYKLEIAIDSFYSDIQDAVIESNKYDKESLGEYFKDGTKNASFKAIDEYITSSREKNKKKEFDGVWFYQEITDMAPLEKDQYKIDYEVTYFINGDEDNVTYKYTGVKVTAFTDENGKLNFEFIDLGDGGKIVK